jgi:4-amino-4-deoxy-L-arabinose transferase-like glycosyltransferase
LRGLRRDRHFWFALAGLALGLALLTRPQLLFLFPLAVGWALVSPRARRRTRLIQALTLGASATVAVAPWVIRNAVVVGKPTISTIGGYTFWGAHNEIVVGDPATRGSWIRVDELIDREHPLPEAEVPREEATWKYGLDYVREHPAQIPALLGMKVWRFLSPIEQTPNRWVFWGEAIAWSLTGPFACAGLLLLLRRRDLLLAVALPILSTLGTVLAFYGSARFRNSLAPLWCLLAAIAWQRTIGMLRPASVRPDPVPTALQNGHPPVAGPVAGA